MRSVERLGSALMSSIAREISAFPGLPVSDRTDSCWAGAARTESPATSRAVIATTHRRASAREGTSELLLDVPCLELGTPVQVHRETCRHIERLEKQDRNGLRDRQGQREKAPLAG